jgi:cytidylate kinase
MKPSMLDRFNRYLAAQAALPDMTRQPVPLSITISREAGAGGLTIAGMLADRLTTDQPASTSTPWAVFDSNLAKQVLEDHKLSPGLEAFITEEAKLPIEEIVEEVLGLHPSRWTMVQHTTKTILRLASLGHAILVGRGAHIITACFQNVLHVRLVSPFSTRVRHTADSHHVSDAEAAVMLRDRDDSRRRYVRVYFNSDIDNPSRYDLTINTGRLGFAGSVDMIAHLAKQHEEALCSHQTQGTCIVPQSTVRE